MVIAHDDEGSGSAVVLLHSGVCDRRMWEPQAAVLATSYRVIRPDLRGFGETPLPGEQYSFADDVLALLDHLRLERAALVGSSLGGRVALEVAVKAADRVTALILLCPALRGVGTTPDAKEFAAEEDRLLDGGNLNAAVELNVATWLGPDASADHRALVGQMQLRRFQVQLTTGTPDAPPQQEPADVDLRQVVAPTLVVSGGCDMDYFQNVARYVADSISGAHLQRLPWAAHLPSLERPSAVNRVITDYLANHQG